MQPRLWGYYYYPSVKANYTVLAPDGFRPPAQEVCSWDPGVARSSLARKGEVMWFTGSDGTAVEFKIAGILPAESELVSSDLILMSGVDFRKLFGIPEGVCHRAGPQRQEPEGLPTIAVKIVEVLPDTRPIIRDEMLRTYEAVFDWQGGIMCGSLRGLFAFAIWRGTRHPA